MVNMDKITRTKLAMLVTVVLLNIFTTIALYYTITVSHVTNLETGDPVVLNMAMLFSIVIAFMWVVALILFHEFKTDDILRTHIHKMELQAKEFAEFKQMVKDTMIAPTVFNSDVLADGGIQGHIPPK